MKTLARHFQSALPPCRFAASPAALRRMAVSAALASACAGMQATACAQNAAGAATTPPPADGSPPADGLWQRATLFGDLGGLRGALDKHGITFTLQETSEYLTNFSGGTRRIGAYDGMTQATLAVDTGKLFGLAGGTLNVSALQIHGTSLTSRALSALQNASGTEAEAGTRLWELWYGQSIAGGAADIRVGQQSVDQEFMVSQTASTFVNATFGWPVLPSVDLPGGGPAYPLSALGVRVKAQPTNALTLLAGVFDGYPGGVGQADVQRANPHGTNFNLHDGALWIGELQYALNAPQPGTPDAQPGGLPGTYKLGVWYLSGAFADPHTDTSGASLAAPDSNGIARTHRGNYGAYAIADQMVWRSAANPSRSLGVFARVMGAPDDRNPINFSAQAGVSLKAPFAGRDNDTAGIALGYTNATLNVDGATSDLARPRRVNETVIEATYQYQVAPWWTLQGDLQYIVRPGGGYDAPAGGTVRPIGNEFVAGLRTVVNF
ncbi:carbohydrate porin [Burkholderia plantarii]|uniref:Carbohydrate-selective porin OprB family n=1 Tax=Burkholderia plantarii TaxID=41899 RepID=A0A0B6RZV8_BURPL|nr:carbohydrate-selective porin OprB family [Burkholderia plantarii]WLE61278.1 carbohydrate porin [Burkholderia plantarii]